MTHQYEMDILNSPITIRKIEIVIEQLPQKKSMGPYGFSGGFYQIFNEELT